MSSLKNAARVLNGDVIIDFNTQSNASEHYVFYDDAFSNSAYIKVLLETRPGWKRTYILTDAVLIFTMEKLSTQTFHECASYGVLLNHLPNENHITDY